MDGISSWRCTFIETFNIYVVIVKAAIPRTSRSRQSDVSAPQREIRGLNFFQRMRNSKNCFFQFFGGMLPYPCVPIHPANEFCSARKPSPLRWSTDRSSAVVWRDIFKGEAVTWSLLVTPAKMTANNASSAVPYTTGAISLQCQVRCRKGRSRSECAGHGFCPTMASRRWYAGLVA